MLKITVWNENVHDRKDKKVMEIYPKGMHGAISDFLSELPDTEVKIATLDMPEHGLTQEVVDNTDVMLWWGHTAHGQVADEIVQRVYDACIRGMGLIFLHSGHDSKIFKKLMGTTGSLSWREMGENERLWVVSPGHPIAKGLGECIDLEHEETYGEFFDIPEPDELVFISWFKGGDVFRSGCCFKRGYGRIFYFRPGHETLPTYHHPDVQTVLRNAALWAAPSTKVDNVSCRHVMPREEIDVNCDDD
ncbi:MAG: ThuA domain-containing protein [Oscillospiraceae bacterium]|nr:ThuA domain-containing protein [Oscillospiraceae bacterium]